MNSVAMLIRRVNPKWVEMGYEYSEGSPLDFSKFSTNCQMVDWCFCETDVASVCDLYPLSWHVILRGINRT